MPTGTEARQHGQIDREIESALKEVQMLADEVRVKLHLASLDAKEAWTKLEPKLEEARKHARDASEDTLSALKDLAKAFRSFAGTLSTRSERGRA